MATPYFHLRLFILRASAPSRRPRRGLAGGGDFGAGVVVFPDVVQAERFADLAGGVGVVLSGGEVAKAEVNLGELAERGGFVELIAERYPGLQALLHRGEGDLAAAPLGGWPTAGAAGGRETSTGGAGLGATIKQRQFPIICAPGLGLRYARRPTRCPPPRGA